MVQVHTGIYRFKGTVGWIALLVAPNDIVAHAEGDDLLEMEYILDNHDGTAGFLSRTLTVVLGEFRTFLLLGATKFGDADAYAKLLATFVTLEYQRLTRRIFRLVKRDVAVAFRASYTFHA